MSPSEWILLKGAAAAFNQPGRFVTFLAAEWTHAYHMNVYFRGDEGEICGDEDGPPCSGSGEFAAFYGQHVLAGMAGAHVNHPRWRVAWHEVDAAVTPNVEMFNHWWDRLWNRDGRHDNERGVGNLLWALQAGHRLGFVGASDHHGHAAEGSVGSGLTGCHVDELTRDQVLDALRARRCYATDGERIVLDFDVAGTAMGGTLAAPIGSAVTATVTVAGTAVPTAIDIVRSGMVVATKTDCTGNECVFSAPVTVADEYSFIYVRVRQPGGRRAWATPVWIHGQCTTSAACPPERFVPGGTWSSMECLYRWRVLNAAARAGRRISCADGDPACDSGTTPEECTFQVGVCTGVSAGARQCQGPAVGAIQLLEPSAIAAKASAADRENRLTLLTAIRALGSGSPEARCTPYVDVRVPLARRPDGRLIRGSRWLSGEGSRGAERDRDVVWLECLPGSAEQGLFGGRAHRASVR